MWVPANPNSTKLFVNILGGPRHVVQDDQRILPHVTLFHNQPRDMHITWHEPQPRGGPLRKSFKYSQVISENALRLMNQIADEMSVRMKHNINLINQDMRGRVARGRWERTLAGALSGVQSQDEPSRHEIARSRYKNMLAAANLLKAKTNKLEQQASRAQMRGTLDPYYSWRIPTSVLQAIKPRKSKMTRSHLTQEEINKAENYLGITGTDRRPYFLKKAQRKLLEEAQRELRKGSRGCRYAPYY